MKRHKTFLSTRQSFQKTHPINYNYKLLLKSFRFDAEAAFLAFRFSLTRNLVQFVLFMDAMNNSFIWRILCNLSYIIIREIKR